jgi:hypothetical protein
MAWVMFFSDQGEFKFGLLQSLRLAVRILQLENGRTDFYKIL